MYVMCRRRLTHGKFCPPPSHHTRKETRLGKSDFPPVGDVPFVTANAVPAAVLPDQGIKEIGPHWKMNPLQLFLKRLIFPPECPLKHQSSVTQFNWVHWVPSSNRKSWVSTRPGLPPFFPPKCPILPFPPAPTHPHTHSVCLHDAAVRRRPFFN